MATTTAHLAHTARIVHSSAARTGQRRMVRRPIVDLAPWMAPFAWMTALAITVCVLGAGAMLRDGVPSIAPATIAVRVAPSDTLWSIAEANRLPGVSTAVTVETIARINDLSDTGIAAGTVLQVPTIEISDAALAQAESDVVTR